MRRVQVTGDELLRSALLVPLALAPPPLYCLLLLRPSRFLAWQIRFWQRVFGFEREPGGRWADAAIDPWPSPLFRFVLGAPSKEVFLYAGDEPERFPRVLLQIRLTGLVLLLLWIVWTFELLCPVFMDASCREWLP